MVSTKEEVARFLGDFMKKLSATAGKQGGSTVMKPTKEVVGWCSPRDMQKLARLATQVVLGRTVPHINGTYRRFPISPPNTPIFHIRIR